MIQTLRCLNISCLYMAYIRRWNSNKATKTCDSDFAIISVGHIIVKWHTSFIGIPTKQKNLWVRLVNQNLIIFIVPWNSNEQQHAVLCLDLTLGKSYIWYFFHQLGTLGTLTSGRYLIHPASCTNILYGPCHTLKYG